MMDYNKSIQNSAYVCLILLLYTVMLNAGGYKPVFENPEDYPFMGDWQGKWINPHAGHEKHHPEMVAQLVCRDKGSYLVRILPVLNLRAVPYIEVMAKVEQGAISVDERGWKFKFQDSGSASGVAMLHGKETGFELKKVERLSPTLAQEPPKGAFVLFDGSGFDEWQHHDGRKLTWSLLESGAMQTVSLFWNDKENQKKGLGGDIVSKRKFSSFKFHMEFRYPVEEGKLGQSLGNSGLFLHGIGELQILNSYGTYGYWNECGSFYKVMPAKVNAAAPPLQWQTYDVEVDIEKETNGTYRAIITAILNGHIIHNKLTMPCAGPHVSIGLQDHINALQYRNIWLVE